MLSLESIRVLSTDLRRLARRHKEVKDPDLSKCLKDLDGIFTQGAFEIKRYLERKRRKRGVCHGDCCGGNDNW